MPFSSTELQRYLEPTQESGKVLIMRNIQGRVVMLNLLRFKPIADYTASPQQTPAAPISGVEAFKLYIEKTMPHLKKSGGELSFLGVGGPYLIGPADERWDVAMLVSQNSVADFIAFASNQEYMRDAIVHRTAAIEDSRLLPLVERSPLDLSWLK